MHGDCSHFSRLFLLVFSKMAISSAPPPHPPSVASQELRKGDKVKVMRKGKIEFQGRIERFRQTGHRCEGCSFVLFSRT